MLKLKRLTNFNFIKRTKAYCTNRFKKKNSFKNKNLNKIKGVFDSVIPSTTLPILNTMHLRGIQVLMAIDKASYAAKSVVW